jgi:hypothetical protein
MRLKIKKISLGLLFLVAVTGVLTYVRFDIRGHFDGIFLLRDPHGWRYTLKDDIYVGEGEYLVYALDFDDPRFRFFSFRKRYKSGEPYLYFEWDDKDGSGFVRNFLGNGTELFISFGRLVDDDKNLVHGLIVGGAMPGSIIGGDNSYMNESGMAFHDGTRWYHI